MKTNASIRCRSAAHQAQSSKGVAKTTACTSKVTAHPSGGYNKYPIAAAALIPPDRRRRAIKYSGIAPLATAMTCKTNNVRGSAQTA